MDGFVHSAKEIVSRDPFLRKIGKVKPQLPRWVDVVFSFPLHEEIKSYFVLCLVITFVGCAFESPSKGVSFVRYTKETFPETARVEVFFKDVEKPYIIIGELKVTLPTELEDEEMVSRMKEVARGIGADAVIGLEREIVEIAIPPVFSDSTRRKARHQPLDISSPGAKEEKILLRGLAIRYR
jgi:uncharacterized protein YbjQ (UPF0145 family)